MCVTINYIEKYILVMISEELPPICILIIFSLIQV
jgi:hypothetical protein